MRSPVPQIRGDIVEAIQLVSQRRFKVTHGGIVNREGCSRGRGHV